MNAEDGVVIARNLVDEHTLSIVFDRRIHGSDMAREEVFEYLIARTQLFVDRVRKVGTAPCQQAETAGLRHGEPVVQELFGNREERRVSTNRERKRCGGGDGEAAGLA